MLLGFLATVSRLIMVLQLVHLEHYLVLLEISEVMKASESFGSGVGVNMCRMRSRAGEYC